ncbi:hypothetical protein MVES_001065 [Malassezia vespertilionis]|uniref:Gpi8p n=1 Tax=Malassezia vespertilionis TaxID=2020962 RepID=A0A2N1JEI9_9BASI|nr:hypothetical protein MVES_001065 [Malassezia vespertilionis]
MGGKARGKTLVRSLALVVALIAIGMAALPALFPAWFLGNDKIEAVTRFFAQDTDAAPWRYTSRARQHGTAHTNNWAVLVGTSKFWFNYRHMANTLGMYRTVKRLGIPDSHIILMLADDVACNSRNPNPGAVWPEADKSFDLYGDDVEVDYRGYEVTVQNFLRLLTGRVPSHTPRSKRLESDVHSNIFLYMTGHGGDEFLKFQDSEEISAFDLADAIEQMWEKRRYHELFFMIDTCQASTMTEKIYSPNYTVDHQLGVPLIDRYTRAVLEFMEHTDRSSNKTMDELVRTMPL